ncbi:MAG: type I DNA topoisomerase [Candidatus Colwellbacteria bacterium]|nr:type I DNA topoisomerase [Candidatus Colwellbacteria bacterium]
MNLVIVESPTKAKTISQFLGKKFKVESSYGHVRDLPKGQLGVDVDNNFIPKYVIPRKVQKRVTALKKLAAKSDNIILATDEDREGEAIAWHLVKALKLDEVGEKKKVERIAFHEITEEAIESALKTPREVNMNLVDAQQMRRVLDRLVGYKLSPFLWKKVASGLSAGRVQSVALRLIVEREEEIRKFKPEEYWTIEVKLKDAGEAYFSLVKIDGKPIEKFDINSHEKAEKIANDLRKTDNFVVASVEKKEVRKNPSPPFITSTLQQEASKRFGYPARRTMQIAQGLYERGIITYMRTDSVNLSEKALSEGAAWIKKFLGEKYAESAPRRFKSTSRLAQEAHEAIRPTNPKNTPEELVENAGLIAQEAKIYDLIWRRFIASQLPVAVFDSTTVAVKAGIYELRTNGIILKFDGFLKIWHTKFEEKELPNWEGGEKLKLVEVIPLQHFTEPPPRFNEASLIKALESYGIGRPSTYASIISVIQTRNYVVKNERRFEPTEIGEMVNGVLTENFPKIVDIQFTARMEEELDEVAEGKGNWQELIKDFYGPFSKNLEEKYEEVKKLVTTEKTDEVCNLCGKPMVIKFGRFGKFLACSGFPECKNTKSIAHATNSINMKCPKCVTGDVIIKRTKRRRVFYGCSRYPECDFASWTKPEPQA